MNRIYRTLWSVATQSWQAVPETAKSAGKKSKSSASGVVASFALSWVLTSAANAQAPPAINQLPTGGTVARGTATINQTATAQAAAMTVNQTSQRAVVNWNTFNIGSNASVNFVQPNAQAVTLNRVSDANPSQIFGRMTSNGQVVLTNANGIYFAPGSSVDVGAITATTHRITDDNFMSGKYVFERNGATGKIINEGNITAALAGYVALLAPEVQNAGVVVARAGTVAMAAGETITLNIDGAGSLAGISTTPSAIATLIENKQAVQAPDGQIILSAVALNKLQAGVIKNSGNLEANSLVSKGGKIVLEADDITLTATSKLEAKGSIGGGTVLVGGDWQGSGDMRQATKVTMEAGASIDASATDKGDGGKVVLWSDIHNANSATRANGSIKAEAGPNSGDGGQIETSGHMLNVDDIQISTQAKQGQDGMWLLDPYDITIATSGDTGTTWASGTTGTAPKIYTSATTSTILDTSITGALSTGNVTIKTGGTVGDGFGNGNITVSADLTIPNNKTLTFDALGGVSGTGNITIGSSAILSFTQNGNSSYTGTLSGTGALKKLGSGNLTLTGNNSYTGVTHLNAGTLNLGSSTALGTTGTINFFGGTLQYSAASSGFDFSNDSGVNRTNNFAAIYSIDTNGQNVTLSGRLSGFSSTNSPGSITKLGAGTLTLSSSNGYYGTTTVNAGTLAISHSWGAGQSPLAVVASGATLELQTVMNALGTITLNGGTLKAGTGSSAYNGAIIFGANGSAIDTSVTMSIGGVISGANYDLTKLGSEVLNLTGANTYSGATIVSAGTLSLGWGSISGSIANTKGISIASGAKFQIKRSDAVTLGYGISGSGSLTNAGLGTLTLTGNNTYTGGTTLSAGTLNLGSANAIGSSGLITFSGGTLQYPTSNSVNAADYSARIDSTTANQLYKIDTNGQNITFASAFGSTGSTFTKLGAGTLTLSGANSYTGLTTVTAGTLAVTNATGLGTTAAGTTVSSGASIDFQGATVGAEAITMSGGSLKASTGTSSLDGAVTLSSATTVDIGGTQLTLNGAVSGSGALTKQGTGTLALIGTNSLSSLTISSGTVRVGNGGTTGVLGSSTSATVNGLLVVDRSNAYSLSNILSSVSGTGNVSISSGGNLTIDKAISLTGANSLIDIFSNGNLSLGAVTLANSGSSGGIKFRANGGVTFSTGTSVLNASGTNGSITVSAGTDLSAGDTTVGYDITMTSAGSSAINTSATGTVNIFQGNANTTALSSKIASAAAGGASTKKYKTYGSTYASLSSSVSGTRNFYYRSNPSGVTVSGVTASKTYDGSTNAIGFITGGTVAGLSSDETGLTGLGLVFATADFPDANAGTGKNLTLGGVSLSNAAWNISGLTATLGGGSSGTINKANLTLSGTKVYDGTTVVSGSQLLATGVHSESFTVTGSGASGNLTSADVQASSTALASVTGLAVGISNGINTGDASNYNLLSTTGSTFSVSRATASLTGLKVYDANNTLTGTQLAITGVTVGGTTQTLNYTGSATLYDPNVATPNNYVTSSNLVLANNGSYLANNYVLPAFTRNANNSATVSAATATVTASKTYDSDTTLSAGQVIITGVSVNGTAQTLGFSGTAALSDANVFTTNKYVNTSGMTLTDGTTGLASNYVLPASAYNATSNTATINRFALTATDINTSSSVYGDPMAPGSVTFANKFGTDDVNAIVTVTVPAGSLSGGGVAKVGNYFQSASTSLTGTKAGNYSFSGLTSQTANYSITPLALTGATISAASSDYGSALTAGTVTFTNALSGDQVTTSASVNTNTLSGAQLPVVGTYTQTTGTSLTGADAGNYTLPTGITGAANYTINAKALTISVPGASRVYDSTTAIYPTAPASVLGVIWSDQVVISAGNVTGFVDKNVGTNKAVTYTGFAFTGSDASNYVLSANPASTANITAKPITVADITAIDKIYNGNTSASLNVAAATLTSGASSDTDNKTYSSDSVSVDTSTAVGTFTNANVGTAKPVTITGLALSGTDAGNYIVTDASNATASITPKTLTVSGTTVANKTYDGTTTANLSNGTLVGVINTDLADVSLTESGVFSDKNAGLAKQVTATNVLSGTAASNYSLTQPTGLTADIYKAELTVSAADAEKIFGNDNTALTVALSGFVGGETLATSGVTGLGLATTNATINTNPGTAVITASVGTLAADNYDFTRFVNGALTIKSIGGLNNTEVASFISGSQLAALSSTQLSRFSAAQLQVFSAQQLASLSASQMMGLTANQVSRLSDGQLLALSPVQVSAFKPEQLSALTPAQISLLTGSSAMMFSADQVLSFSPSQMAAIHPAVVARMSTTELGALSDAQLQALTPTQIAAIAPANFAAFTPAQIMAMSIAQVQNLSPEQLATFTPAQIASLNAAEIAYFDARQLAAIGIFPKVQTPVAEAATVVPPVEIATGTTPVAVATETPTSEINRTDQEVADATDVTTDKKENRIAYEAAIPVMTEVAASALPLTATSTTAATTTASTPTATSPEQPSALSPRALQAMLFAPNTESSSRTGVLAITILNSTQAKPTTAGIAFEQDADSVSLRFTSAPSAPPMTDKVVFTDKLISFMVATPTGEMVEFEGTLVNNRMVIVAPSVAAKRVARTEMNLVLAAAVTSLGKERRVMLANLTGVLLDLR